MKKLLDTLVWMLCGWFFAVIFQSNITTLDIVIGGIVCAIAVFGDPFQYFFDKNN